MQSRSVAEAESCHVCGQLEASGCNFGVLSCRACAAFFRRSVNGQRHYKCPNENQCRMRKAMRYSCRACRWKLCLERGMKPEAVRSKPVTEQSEAKNLSDAEEPSTSAATAKPQTYKAAKPNVCRALSPKSQSAQIPLPLPTPTGHSPLLDAMHRGYGMYNQQHLSLFRLLYPHLDPDELRMVKHSDHIKMERGCMTLVFGVLNEYYRPFDALDSKTRERILRSFSTYYSILDQCYQTMTQVPEDKNIYILHPGQILDGDQLHRFFADDRNPDESAQHLIESRERVRNIVQKIRKLKVRHTEISALIGVALWNEVALSAPEYVQLAEKQRDAIYRELHADIVAEYGAERAGHRMGTLIFMLQSLEVMVGYFMEVIVMGQIFYGREMLFEEE